MEYNIAILISGRGSNMLNIIRASKNKEIKSKIITVISQNPNAAGLQKAEREKIKTKVINPKDYNDNKSFEKSLSDFLESKMVDLICLAGFMKILSASFINNWRDKIINIHPSLLPSFKGLNTHKRAIDMKVKYSGCTVHFVNGKVDSGKIIDQDIVKVLKSDDEISLQKKILMKEHKLYIRVLKKMEKFNE